jgi:hypothetical protein
VTTTMARDTNTTLARPLRVLVPLIQEELRAGEAAGLEHYRNAGSMLIEAKDQVPQGEWLVWVQRNFDLSKRTAQKYMQLARESATRRAGGAFQSRTLSEALGDLRTDDRGGAVGASVQQVRRIVATVDVERLTAERQTREREAKLIKALASQLIDIGYRVLAAKLHPDRGGSTEAMARLNRVRSLLRNAL